jgi:DNA-binding response OmpR family regulator
VAHILVADDDENVTDLLRAMFEDEGHTVSTAHDGSQALDLLNQHGADLLLLDVSMPRMDGMQTLRNLRQMRRWAGLPVVILSSHPASTHSVPALCEGADAYVSKPFARHALAHRAHSLLLGRGCIAASHRSS